jgi:diguanylate cyclase (GGDEF)-like protein
MLRTKTKPRAFRVLPTSTLERRIRTLEAENKKQKELIRALERAKKILEHEHNTDYLTSVSSRKVFERTLEHSFRIVRGEEKEHRSRTKPLKVFSVVFIDLDHFKQVNDMYGHIVGDDILKRAADRMRSAVRETDVLARYGGDEFVLLLRHTGPYGALIAAEHLLARVAKDPVLKQFGITASIGITSSKTDGAEDAKTLLQHADQAAYEAKRGGRNRIEVYKGV